MSSCVCAGVLVAAQKPQLPHSNDRVRKTESKSVAIHHHIIHSACCLAHAVERRSLAEDYLHEVSGEPFIGAMQAEAVGSTSHPATATHVSNSLGAGADQAIGLDNSSLPRVPNSLYIA